MKKPIRCAAALLAMLLVSSFCSAQDNAERTPIKVFKKCGGYRYTYETKPLRMWADFQSIMQDSPEAVDHLNSAKMNSQVSIGLSLAGGALIGWPLGQAMAGAEPAWILAAVGGGLVAISIGFGVGSSKQLKKAVDAYNKGIQEVTLTLEPNGIGVQLRM